MTTARPVARKAPDTGGQQVQLEVHPNSIVCTDCKVQGISGIKIGEGTVVHPSCLIHAKAGPIEIGRFNVLEEQVRIVNNSETPLVIGDYNTFEVGTRVIGADCRVGDANVFECRSQLGSGATVGNGCTLGICVVVPDGEQIQDETVIIGPSGLRHHEEGAKESHMQAVMKHIEALKETLPRCHHLKKPRPQ